MVMVDEQGIPMSEYLRSNAYLTSVTVQENIRAQLTQHHNLGANVDIVLEDRLNAHIDDPEGFGFKPSSNGVGEFTYSLNNGLVLFFGRKEEKSSYSVVHREQP